MLRSFLFYELFSSETPIENAFAVSHGAGVLATQDQHIELLEKIIANSIILFNWEFP